MTSSLEAIVEKLQQSIQNIGISLFNLIKEDYRVGAATYCLGKLTTQDFWPSLKASFAPGTPYPTA
jgi:hypothetical protein